MYFTQAEVKKNEKKNKKFIKETEDEDVESVDVDEIKVLFLYITYDLIFFTGLGITFN